MSRFVSSGGADAEPTDRDAAWLEAQKRIDATRLDKPKASTGGGQEGGLSLYDTLQANKAAKQDAFEEASRLRNQFRSLDEDEVEFLDAVMESTREKEKLVGQETREQLEAFRKRKEDAEKAARLEEQEAEDPVGGGEVWAVAGRKRKKGREREGIGGVKVRRTSTNGEAKEAEGAGSKREVSAKVAEGQIARSPQRPHGKDAASASMSPVKASSSPSTAGTKALTPPASALGLTAYSSDEDD